MVKYSFPEADLMMAHANQQPLSPKPVPHEFTTLNALLPVPSMESSYPTRV